MVDTVLQACLKLICGCKLMGRGLRRGLCPLPRKKETITRYGLSELRSPSCQLFTQYACSFVFIRLAAQDHELLAQLYIRKHSATRNTKMGIIGTKRVVVRWLEAVSYTHLTLPTNREV